jgi:type I restriction enzyme S subunit
MKKRWERKQIGDLCEVVAGQSPEGKFYNTDGKGMPFYQGKKDFGEKFIEAPTTWTTQTTKIAREGDILMSVRAPVGPVNFATDEACIGRGLAAIRSRAELNRDFLFYQLLHLQSEIAGKEGAVFASINKSEIEALPVAFAPLPEQQRIVGILDEAFDGIATAKANAEKNLQNARALFESHLQSVFTQRGPGWVERMLGDKSLLEIIDGDRGVNYPKASDFHDQGHCLFLNTKNVRPDGFDFESTMFITAEKDRQLRKGKLKRDDVVLTTRGTIGNIGLYSDDISFDNIRINSGMLIFRPNKDALLPSFLFELLRSEIVKDQIREQTTGAAQPQLPIKTLVNFMIPVPSNLGEQRTLVKKIRAFEPETQRLESIYQQKLDALEALKKSLLHQAFNGQL